MHAFGLEIEGPALPGLLPGPGPQRRSVRVETHEASADQTAPGPPTVAPDPGGGFILRGGEHGEQRVSRDGRWLEAWLPPGPAWRWQRLLFGQALPLAATLQGLACLHASAVVLEGRAIALVGGSGAGKSTLAATLVGLGAQLLTDDVLAVEREPHGVVAHSGPAFASVDAEQHHLGPVTGRSDKLHVAPDVAPPAPILDVVLLDRGDHPVARTLAEPRPLERLLTAAFVPWVEDPAAHVALLDVCGVLAADARVRRLELPMRAVPEDVARLLL